VPTTPGTWQPNAESTAARLSLESGALEGSAFGVFQRHGQLAETFRGCFPSKRAFFGGARTKILAKAGQFERQENRVSEKAQETELPFSSEFRYLDEPHRFSQKSGFASRSG